ncbi:helix-turn-helix domain-containing protein, partial [Enterobacter hormaechei]
IEKAANKPTNWLDIDKFMPVREEVQDVDFGEIGKLASWNLKRWMSENRNLSSQQRLAEESGVSQSTINRFLNNEAS